MHTFFHGWRRKAGTPKILTIVGEFVFDGRSWVAHSHTHNIELYLSSSECDANAIEATKAILDDIDRFRREAISFAVSNGQSAWDGKGTLSLESLDITEITVGRFGLTFGLVEEDDMTVSVEYENGKPTEVWAAD